MMKTLVTGGTGFVGKKLLSKLDNPGVVTRNALRSRPKLPDNVGQVIEWDAASGPTQFSDSFDYQAVVNLMGESIADGRWNEDKKKRIRDSRVLGTRNLVDSLLALDRLPSVLVSASAVGFYGDPGEEVVTEQHAMGDGFLPDVCRDWENEAVRLAEHGVRVVLVRIGIVLGKEGGALEKMLPLFRWGLGGKLGDGQQWMPWIHVDDLVDMIVWTINADDVSGPVNGVAPNPVRNADFTQSLAKAVNRPAVLPAPRFGLKLALGEFADSLFFSQRVVPEKALANGFVFQFGQLDSALSEVVAT
jgi:uncharacterized protein (TIGR01777 family)